MSPAIEGLVEASSSLARVKLGNGEFITQSLQRSSVDSSKEDVSKTVGSAFKMIGCDVQYTGSYPGWEPNSNSPILTIMKDLYVARFNEEPNVMLG